MTRTKTTVETNEAEREAGYRAFMLRCMTYAAAHADADDEAWSKHHNYGVDVTPMSDDYAAGYDVARERILRETRVGFGMFSPRERTARMPEHAVRIPLKGEPGYADYEAKRRRALLKTVD